MPVASVTMKDENNILRTLSQPFYSPTAINKIFFLVKEQSPNPLIKDFSSAISISL
jgi:hypothetical protein